MTDEQKLNRIHPDVVTRVSHVEAEYDEKKPGVVALMTTIREQWSGDRLQCVPLTPDGALALSKELVEAAIKASSRAVAAQVAGICCPDCQLKIARESAPKSPLQLVTT